jgi:hypothetical protein
VGQQDQAHAGGGECEPAADAGQHRHRPGARDPLDEHDLGALSHRELHVLPGDLGKVLQERQRRLAQARAARGERADLPQPQPDAVQPVAAALHGPPLTQFADQPVRGGQRHAGAPGDLAQGQLAPPRAERVKQPQRTAGHRAGGAGPATCPRHC